MVLIAVLICVSFYTLFERKILGLSHIRLGPTVVRVYGLMQPFRDAIKLFIKSNITPNKSNYNIYLLAPAISCFRSLGC